MVRLEVDDPTRLFVALMLTTVPFSVNVLDPMVNLPLVKVSAPETVVPALSETPAELLSVILLTLEAAAMALPVN